MTDTDTISLPEGRVQLEPLTRLNKDVRAAAMQLGHHEARFLVDRYYQQQRDRIRAGHQERTLGEAGEPASVLAFFSGQNEVLEKQIAKALDAYSGAHPIGVWMRAQKGIGPVLASGLLAHIDIEKAPTVGHIWRYAGLDPTMKWEKGQKRPWNASLKLVCWKIGESFVKVSGDESSIYGQIYRKRKAQEVAKSGAKEFADQAAAALAAKKFSRDTEAFKAYDKGELPAARLNLRAQRVAVKIFLSHMHEVWYRWHFGEEPPKPFSIAIQGHGHYIPPPGPYPTPRTAEEHLAAKASAAQKAAERMAKMAAAAEEAAKPKRGRKKAGDAAQDNAADEGGEE